MPSVNSRRTPRPWSSVFATPERARSWRVARVSWATTGGQGKSGVNPARSRHCDRLGHPHGSHWGATALREGAEGRIREPGDLPPVTGNVNPRGKGASDAHPFPEARGSCRVRVRGAGGVARHRRCRDHQAACRGRRPRHRPGLPLRARLGLVRDERAMRAAAPATGSIDGPDRARPADPGGRLHPRAPARADQRRVRLRHVRVRRRRLRGERHAPTGSTRSTTSRRRSAATSSRSTARTRGAVVLRERRMANSGNELELDPVRQRRPGGRPGRGDRSRVRRRAARRRRQRACGWRAQAT